jgi:hypothetical protein
LNKTFAVCLHQIRGRQRSRKSLLAAGLLTAIKVPPFWESADLYGKCRPFPKMPPFFSKGPKKSVLGSSRQRRGGFAAKR